jgi:catechol 2,3-dioxygenase-like lactoylglutathione lyase family enzyme
MHRFRLRALLAGFALVIVGLSHADTTGTVSAPPPLTPPARRVGAEVTGCSSYILTVGNIDRSLRFYRDVIGLELLRTPGAPSAQPTIQRLTATPGALWRSAAFHLPLTSTELLLTEYTRIARRALRPRAVDPGAATLVVTVRDLGPILAAARIAQTPILTRGGQPLSPHPGERAIVFLDPDGVSVSVSEMRAVRGGASAGAASVSEGNVVSARMTYTVAAPATVIRFYRDALALNIVAGSYASSSMLDALIDSPGAQYESIRATPAGDQGLIEFVSYRGIARHTYRGRPQDSGTPGIALTVRNLTAALRRVRATGASIVTAGGEPVTTAHGAQAVFVHDPAGILVELIQER